MSGGIFISYRRDDTSFVARRLYDWLFEQFPHNRIFMDLDHAAHGKDLVKTIEKAIESSDILIAVIGKRWLISDLGNLDDYVHLELAAAFKRNTRVIPVLVEGASLPLFDELPDDLKALVRLRGLPVSACQISCKLGRRFEPPRFVDRRQIAGRGGGENLPRSHPDRSAERVRARRIGPFPGRPRPLGGGGETLPRRPPDRSELGRNLGNRDSAAFRVKSASVRSLVSLHS
jgi:hypothetical protein